MTYHLRSEKEGYAAGWINSMNHIEVWYMPKEEVYKITHGRPDTGFGKKRVKHIRASCLEEAVEIAGEWIDKKIKIKKRK